MTWLKFGQPVCSGYNGSHHLGMDAGVENLEAQIVSSSGILYGEGELVSLVLDLEWNIF